jgi:hypothetical protein
MTLVLYLLDYMVIIQPGVPREGASKAPGGVRGVPATSTTLPPEAAREQKDLSSHDIK